MQSWLKSVLGKSSRVATSINIIDLAFWTQEESDRLVSRVQLLSIRTECVGLPSNFIFSFCGMIIISFKCFW